jgi:hypothetical protein
LIAPYWGGAAGALLLTGAAAIATVNNASNNTWRFQALLTVRSIGSSGTILGTGDLQGVSSATAVNMLPASSPAVATVDTTAAKALVLCAQWGTNSASDTITCQSWAIETLN